MATFVLQREQVVPRRLHEMFACFSDPRNLEALTPPWLRFRIVAISTPDVRAGSRIRYRLRLRGLPVGWTTLISDWSPPHRFMDQQLSGPYRHWEHTHEFSADPGGTRARDRVEYEVPGGRLVERWLLRPDLERIFDHRAQRLGELLGRRERHEALAGVEGTPSAGGAPVAVPSTERRPAPAR